MNSKMKSALSIVNCKINEILQSESQVIVAIDGMSGSGKTTFANALCEVRPSTLIHMDDFFLRPEQRTHERLNTPGGNSDTERILNEVILPIYNDKSFIYKPFNCHIMDFDESRVVVPKEVVIIEGSYSCHPDLFEFCDLHIFLYTDEVNQIKRIQKRSGFEKAKSFINTWIPLENKYFEHYKIMDRCEFKFLT